MMKQIQNISKLLAFGAVVLLLQACGGGDPEIATAAQQEQDNFASTAFAASKTIPTPTLVLAPVNVPGLDAAGNVQWPVGIDSSTVTLNVRPFATIPFNSDGKIPRLNVLANLGSRIYVAEEKQGRIYEITNGNVRLWFNVADAIYQKTGRRLNSIADNAHSGLRSIAFHPNFASNGRFYTSLMEDRPASPANHKYLSDVGNPVAGDSVLVEWTANRNTRVPTANSYREVFRVGIPVYDHPIKQISFRPGALTTDADYGLLYIAHGDGSVQSVTAGGGMANDARGKILRINPLKNGAANYSIPASNPFVGSTSMIPEAYSIGHRNPHHLAFAKDGTLLVAEDGRDNIDEVNIVKAGANYGWPVREGSLVHLPAGGLQSGVGALPADDAINNFTYPVMQFLHTGKPNGGFTGQALGGGYVVENGTALDGYYFATDFVKSGDVFLSPLSGLKAAITQGAPSALRMSPIARAKILFDHDNNSNTAAKTLNNLNELTILAPDYDKSGRVDMRYGQGPRGELYLLSKRDRRVYLVTNSMP